MVKEKSKEQSKTVGKKILIVDDNMAFAAALKCALLPKGFVLDTAKDGVEALEKVKKNDYDAVLTDIIMPRMNGYEATRRLRALDFEKPIIGISAFDFKEDIDEGLAAGMNAYVSKAIKPAALMKLLADLL
ncbi:MAG: response regulator [Cytophagales bacterium]|nr:response regulator [Cytophagales bacterium]